MYVLDKYFKTLKHFNTNSGLSDNYIYGMLNDDFGKIWVSHQSGLSSINSTNFTITNYGKEDGINEFDFNNRAFYKTKNQLYFGGNLGLTSFSVPLKLNQTQKPEVYIDEIKVNNIPYNLALNNDLISNLELKYFQNNLSFHAIVKDIEYGKTQKLIYRLNKNEWKISPNSDPVEFNNLASGSYHLDFGYYNKYNAKYEFQRRIYIKIKTPFWKAIWFWILLTFIITCLIFWWVYTRKIVKQKRIFNQQIELNKQRQSLIADLHDDIGASLSSLQVNSAIASAHINKDTNEAKKLLNKIENQAKNLAEKMGDFIWSTNQGENEVMSISSRIKNYANEMLSATNIAFYLHFDVEVDQLKMPIKMRKNLVLISKEAINNVIKYSKAKHFWLNFTYDKNILYLEIKDDGIGFDPTNTSGNGLKNIKNRTEELNGTFKIESSNNGSTLFIILNF